MKYLSKVNELRIFGFSIKSDIQVQKMQAWDGLTLLAIYFYSSWGPYIHINVKETNGSKKDE